MKRATAVVLAAALTVTAQALGGDPGAADLKTLQGNWELVDVDGKKVEEEFRIEATITDNRVTFTNPGNKKNTAKFKLDATKKPKHFDILPADPNDKKNVTQGIYEV